MSRPKAEMHHVAVTATKAGDRTHFKAQSNLWDDSREVLRFHKDHHGMRKHDYHLVEFVLDDRTDDKLKFPGIPHDAMWVSKIEPGGTTPCPDRNSGTDYSVIEPICVCDEGRRLVVRNDNPRPEQWAFTMNFVRSTDAATGTAELVSWDPIIDNHDGGN